MLWHHEVHRSRGERLYFWRLAFDPTYQRDAVKSDLEAVLGQHGVKSAVCYELFGAYDLLLRVWLPPVCDLHEFQDSLVKTLTPDDLIMCDPFVVRRPVRHWLFDDLKKGSPKKSAYTDLADEDITEIESGAADERRLGQLVEGNVIGDLQSHSQKTSEDNPGIKFAVAIGGDPRLTTRQARQFETTVTTILDEAEAIEQRSLYSGDGFGHFLIMGRLPADRFFELGDTIIDRVNCDPIHNDYQARTYTHLSGQRTFLIIQESLVREFGGSASSVGPPASTPAAVESKSGLDVALEQLKERYEIRKELGRGGFAAVYEVFDTLAEEPRALKISLAPGSPDRIRREVGALLSIEHPHVLQVFWAERTRNRHYYIVSELLAGATMEGYARGDKELGLDVSISVIDQLLDALSAIHPDQRRIDEIRRGLMSLDQFNELQELQEAGIVHRDVKPANVILGPDNQVKLLDFNIASGAGEPVVTRSGTPPYQPPDLPPNWDPSIDLFAVGVMLYQFLTGRHPYPDEEPSAAVTPTRARAYQPNLPISLENFLAKAVAPYAGERFKSAVEMREALRQAKRDADLETHSDSLGERVKVFREQKRLSLHDLVDRSGVEEAMVSKIEMGKLSPTIAVAKKLAEGLDVPLAALLGERGGRITDQATSAATRP